MANTAASMLGSDICLNQGDSQAECELGVLADAYSPGDVVYQSTAGVWTKQANNAGQLCRTGIVGYRPRMSSTMGRCDIDTAYAASDTGGLTAPIWVSGICIVKILDQNGTIGIDASLILSGTLGALTVGATSIDAGCARNMHAVVDNDTYTIAGIGAFKIRGRCM